MNIKKGILAGTIIMTIGISSLTNVLANPNTNTNGTTTATSITVDATKFEKFSEQFKDTINQRDYNKAKDLFNKAIDIEKKFDEKSIELCKLDLFDETNINVTDADTIFTFEDFSKDFKKDVKPEVVTKAKKLFNQINALEKNKKFDEANKLWDELSQLDLFDDIEMMDIDVTNETNICDATFTFEDFSKDFKKNVKPEVVTKAKKLFDQINAFEKNNEFEKATKLWDELFQLDLYDIKIDTIDVTNALTNDLSNDFTDDVTNDVNISDNIFNFEHISKNFKKDVKPEVLAKAKKLTNELNELEKELSRLWNELDNMDIYK
jgi:tetratricopeptide (TPR) repeat protein